MDRQREKEDKGEIEKKKDKVYERDNEGGKEGEVGRARRNRYKKNQKE